MTFKFISLGCKVNYYECIAIKTLLENNGYQEDENNPDIVIINTCSVTQTADQKSRQNIRKARKNFPNSLIVVMGCYVQGHHDVVKNELQPDIMVGTSNRHLILQYINQYLQDKKPIDAWQDNPRLFCYEEFGVASCSERVRAFLKIQDGCDNFCSYCLIPFIRGKARSRLPSDVLKEAQELVNNGYQEIVLTGIHVGGYGNDLENYSFSQLVDDISQIPGLYSLRISSIEESEIDEKLIQLIKTRKNIAKHLHIPLQSGSSHVLQLMHRKYDKDAFINKLIHIQNEIPHIALTTDVIVGFPGESDEDFNDTVETIKKCGFHKLHVFPFSPREKTIAYSLPDQVSPLKKKERSHKLLELSEQLWNAYTSRFENKEVEVLIEEFDGVINKGHTSNYLEVEISSDQNLVGQVVKTNFKCR